MFHSIKLSVHKVYEEVLLLLVSCQNYLFEVIELFALIMCTSEPVVKQDFLELYLYFWKNYFPYA